MKGIYDFYKDFGRMGSIEGVFVAEDEEVEAVIGEEIYFGECLGKHSEVFCEIKPDDITLRTDSLEFIEAFIKIFNDGTISGYNPLDYVPE